MARLLIPLLLLLLGLGGGVGAGLALAPQEDPEAALAAELADPCGVPPPAGAAHAEAAPAEGDAEGGAAAGREYMALPNQFVVPLMSGDEVGALMLLSLSVELPAGGQERVQPLEPKLRGALLQALFDQATTGGFDGAFTASESRRALRAALLEAAERATEGLVTDVLVTEMVRQDR